MKLTEARKIIVDQDYEKNNEKVQCQERMLSTAQTFLAALTIIIASTIPQYMDQLKECQKLINDYSIKNNNSFVDNFFRQIKVDKENLVPLILNFNTNILKLHIDAKKHGVFLQTSPLNIPHETKCRCGSIDFVEYEGCNQCDQCGLVTRNQLAVAWSDVSRVHASPTYLYDRRVQFKEWLINFQGKCQNLNFEIIDKILLPKRKFSKIEFLRYIKQSNRYKVLIDQIHGLYYHYMKIPAPDLTLLENNLLNDFDSFTAIYSQLLLTSNATLVSNQLLLYQFLKRYNFPITKDDVLLTDARVDKECEIAFKRLGWAIFN